MMSLKYAPPRATIVFVGIAACVVGPAGARTRAAKDTMFFVASGAEVTPFSGQVDVLGGEAAKSRVS